MNRIFLMFFGLLAVMWIATVCDWAFNLDWGWDFQIIWLAPLMSLFAVFVRFCCMLIFSLVERNFNGS